MSLPKRSGRNRNAYAGEPLNLDGFQRELQNLAGQFGWVPVDLLTTSHLHLQAFTRCTGSPGVPRLYLSAGIHGDEPAGPLAILEWMKRQPESPELDVWICPCLNPTGFSGSLRTNRDGIDLNRDYRNPKSPEIQAHCRWLDGLPRFDLSLCLHEDWEAGGFYLYEARLDSVPSIAPEMLAAVEKVCPIDHSDRIDGYAASQGIIRPELRPEKRPEWPEAFYLYRHKSDLVYTLESPSDFDLPVRVAALLAAIERAASRLQ